MNKEEVLKLAEKWAEVLSRENSATKNQLVGEMQIIERHREDNGRLYEIEENKYDIVVKNEEGVENVFFLDKDTNIYFKRPNGEEFKVLKFIYENRVPSYNYENNNAYIVIDVWGENNEDKNNILDFPLVRLTR